VVVMAEVENTTHAGIAAVNEASAIVRPPHVLAAEAAIEALAVTPLTMSQRLKFSLTRVMEMTFPAERQTAVAARIKELCDVGMACIKRYLVDSFEREHIQFWHEIQLLSRPVPQPTERERIGLQIARAWTGPRGCPEIDELFSAMTPEEKVLRFDFEKVIVAGPRGERILTRRALRLRSRPSYSTISEADWIDRFGPIREPHAGKPAGA
jgi:hypothetical protein